MKDEKISRNKFLKDLGLGGSALFAVYCSGFVASSCTNEAGVTPSGDGLLTIDLTLPANADLNSKGGYIRSNDIVVANVGGSYVAVSQICTHENLKQIVYRNDEFYCTAHGARYNTTGMGLNANGSKGITVYKTTLVGNILTVS